MNINELDKNQKYVVSDLSLKEKMTEHGLDVAIEDLLPFDQIDAIVNGRVVSISEIRPLYLRKSQAEIQRENKVLGVK